MAEASILGCQLGTEMSKHETEKTEADASVRARFIQPKGHLVHGCQVRSDHQKICHARMKNLWYHVCSSQSHHEPSTFRPAYKFASFLSSGIIFWRIISALSRQMLVQQASYRIV